MADGATHERAYVTGMAVAGCACTYWVFTESMTLEQAWGVACGVMLGLMFDPDMRDQHDIKTRGENRFYRVPLIGWLLGRLVQWYWWLPSSIIPHRSPFSHLPGLGTAIAAAWLFLPGLTLYWWLAGVPQPWLAWIDGLWQPWMNYAFAGWCYMDLIHLMLDGGNIRWSWKLKGS